MHVYGLLGLLDVISMTKQDLTTVTLGLDLTQLGLNLGSQEPLHKTFSSPWLEGPPNNKNFKIPQCYRMQPPALRPQNFQKFSLETLFFIFYAVPRDLLQAAAAQELYNRKWRYHKQLKQWISRAPRTDPTVKTAAFEKGTYICFDPSRWEKLRKENFLLMYEQLEELRFAKPQGQAQAGSAQQQQQHQALHQALAASQQVPHQPQP
jgi:CCR4-NOT transcription complex subunit 2